MTIFLTLVFTILLIPFLVLYLSFSWGFVASIIYSWFITPVFPNSPDLNWMQFAGIMFFINCFVHSSTSAYIKDECKDSTNGFTTSVLSPWMLLLGAWIFKIVFI